MNRWVDISSVELHTINDGAILPIWFPPFLALLFLATFITVVVLRRYSGKTVNNALVPAFVIASAICASAYAIHAEITWYAWTRASTVEFTSNRPSSEWASADARLGEIAATAHRLTGAMEYEFYPRDAYTEMRFQYLMLPAVRKHRADTIVVIGAPDVRYSTSDNVIHAGNTNIGKAALITAPYSDACILQRQSSR